MIKTNRGFVGSSTSGGRFPRACAELTKNLCSCASSSQILALASFGQALTGVRVDFGTSLSRRKANDRREFGHWLCDEVRSTATLLHVSKLAQRCRDRSTFLRLLLHRFASFVANESGTARLASCGTAKCRNPLGPESELVRREPAESVRLERRIWCK